MRINKKSLFLYCFIFLLIGICSCSLNDKDNSDSQNSVYTKENPYLISSSEDLFEFAEKVNSGNDFDGQYVLQTENIDLKGEEWTTIAPFDSEYEFKGIYDGGGHYIKNLTINTDSNNSFFGKLAGQVINFGIYSGTITGNCVGSITSHSSGENAKIINCFNMATVIGNRAGGIADNFSGCIINCWTKCQIQGTVMSGGIISYPTADVINSYSIEYIGSSTVNKDGITTVNRSNYEPASISEDLNQDINDLNEEYNFTKDGFSKWAVTADGNIAFENQIKSTKLKAKNIYIIIFSICIIHIFLLCLYYIISNILVVQNLINNILSSYETEAIDY